MIPRQPAQKERKKLMSYPCSYTHGNLNTKTVLKSCEVVQLCSNRLHHLSQSAVSSCSRSLTCPLQQLANTIHARSIGCVLLHPPVFDHGICESSAAANLPNAPHARSIAGRTGCVVLHSRSLTRRSAVFAKLLLQPSIGAGSCRFL